MLLGIDVGGTFTDAVLIENGRVIASAKKRTQHDRLMVGVLAALDAVLACEGVAPQGIEQVTLSTTVVTNAIVSHQLDPVDLYVVAGPGMNVTHSFPVEPIFIRGYTDHRGLVQEPFKETDFMAQVKGAHRHSRAAVSAKFAVRNPREEQRLAALLDEQYDFVSTGSSLSGALNFPRRTISAYYNSAVVSIFETFREEVKGALTERQIQAPLYILKADGGSLPIDGIADRPVETAFTGPAASVLGLKALEGTPYHMAVALDIGGTTTDISLWEDGQALMAREGVSIDGYPSSVRSFLVRSLGMAGETALSFDRLQNKVSIGPERRGPSVALGGQVATLADALICLGQVDFGDADKARQAMADFGQRLVQEGGLESLLADAGLLTETGLIEQDGPSLAMGDLGDVESESLGYWVSQAVCRIAVRSIQEAIDTMVAEANQQPIYVVEDLVNPHRFQPDTLVLIGGSARAFSGILAKYTEYRVIVPEEAAVANAIGAALARHTLELTLHLDTKQGVLTVPELGLQEENPSCYQGQDVVAYGFSLLEKEAKRLGISPCGMACTSLEDFPVVAGGARPYRIITARVQLEAGVSDYVR